MPTTYLSHRPLRFVDGPIAMDHHHSTPHQMPNIPEPQKPTSPQTSYSSESELKDTTISQSGAKRRPSRAGTRSVSTLTAAQLERKRANDREAQRAIRQRTREHIENLERRIAELSATDDTSSKLMHALQRIEELEQEVALLRGRLGGTVGVYPGEGEGMRSTVFLNSTLSI